MNIKDTPTRELVSDYKRLDEIEKQCSKLWRKYNPDSVFEADGTLIEICLELGDRVISGRDVQIMSIPDTHFEERKEKLELIENMLIDKEVNE